MPWYRNYFYRQRRRRPFRRPRKTFRRRWRTRKYRRRYWVRHKKYKKRKFKKLRLKEYQPKTIRKCKVKGLCCLFQCNKKKVYFNYNLYESSLVPKHLPGGGGWSTKAFSLDSLYEDHEHCRNVWTGSNVNLPLVRYLGCKFKLYQSYDQDYVFLYENSYPMISTMEKYNATQPSMLAIHKHSKKIPCKLSQKRKRPYKIVRARPPAQMQNKWYFAQDLSHLPLILIHSAATSFDNYYTSTDWESNNIDIISLKAGLFTNTNFTNLGTNPYHCTTTPQNEKVYLYATDTTDSTIKAKHLICLGNTKDHVQGHNYEDPHKHGTDWTQYSQNPKNWGNPFHPDYLKPEDHIKLFQSKESWAFITSKGENHIPQLTEVDNFTETLRYTPNRDTGEINMCYFKPTFKNENDWSTPNTPDLVNNGYPLWLLLWGYTDFIKRTQKYTNLETSYCLVIRTDTTSPTRNIIIPLSLSFKNGHSPFETAFNGLDYNRWHPSLQMQYESINNICMCGPGTPKLGDKDTTEAKIEYVFYFKFGGSPPAMSEIEDPAQLPKYTIPSNIRSANTIESPSTPMHTFLYNFDTKKDIITRKAAKRITKDYTTKKTMFTDGTSLSTFQEEIYNPQETSESEEEEKTLIEQLKQQRQQQQQLKQRLLQRLNQQNLE